MVLLECIHDTYVERSCYHGQYKMSIQSLFAVDSQRRKFGGTFAYIKILLYSLPYIINRKYLIRVIRQR